jgi:homoserine/homoserine lactone efflux protein
MSLETWIAFCALETALCLSPGPAVIFVVSAALGRGPRSGLAAAFGNLSGKAIYFALSATGIAAIILASGTLFTALKWAGAAYLVWLGIGMLRAVPAAPAPIRPATVAGPLVRGFAVQAANPKALAFFLALLPQFIDPHAPVGLQILILGASSFVIELMVLGCYIGIAVRARRFAGGRWGTWLLRGTGALLVAAGARLALARAPQIAGAGSM